MNHTQNESHAPMIQHDTTSYLEEDEEKHLKVQKLEMS